MSESLNNANSNAPAVIVCRHGEKRNGLYPFRALLTLLVVIVLHIPFWFMVEKHPDDEKTTDEIPPHLIILPSVPESGNASHSGANNLADMYGWIQLNDPHYWLSPDWNDGFSKYNQSEHQYKIPHLPSPPLHITPIQRIVVPSSTFLIDDNGEEDKNPIYELLRKATPLPARKFNPPIIRYIPHAVYWRMADTGDRLTYPPQLSSEAVALWEKSETRLSITQPTVIEISSLPGISIPRILIRQCCGVPSLDLAARNAVQKRLIDTKPSPVFFNSPLLLEIDWAY